MVSMIGAHLLKEHNKIADLAIKDDLNKRFRHKMLDVFEYKNKHYLFAMTKYGYTLWVIYIIVLNLNLEKISFGLSQLLVKYYF